MKLSSLWRKPGSAELVSSMIDKAKQELADAEMQRILAVDLLHTAEASVSFHKARVKMLQEMEGVEKVATELEAVSQL